MLIAMLLPSVALTDENPEWETGATIGDFVWFGNNHNGI
jgi:hypothetical protein